MPMPLIFLNGALSSSNFVRNVPSGKGMTMRSKVHSVSITLLIACYRITWTLLACPMLRWIMAVWICNSCKSFWTVPNICMYFYSNWVHSFVVVLWTLSVISPKSPSMRTIVSTCAWFSYFCFFLGPEVVFLARFFNLKGVLFLSSLPLSFSDCSYSSVRCEVDVSNSTMSSFATHTLSIASLAANSFFFWSANSPATTCASSFHFLCSYCLCGRDFFAFAHTYTKICGFSPLF